MTTRHLNQISHHLSPFAPRKSAPKSSPRAGLTLIEIMIALTMTLVVLGAMMQAFKYASAEMSKGRAVIELSNQMRVAEEILRRDLNNITVELRLHTQTTIPLGYLEHVEGPRTDDADLNPTLLTTNKVLYGYLGDMDDILAFTARDIDRGYRGRFYDVATQNTSAIESNVAEIVWWTSFSDRNQNQSIEYDESVTVFRRVLLVLPELGTMRTDLTPNQVNYFFRRNDISARVVPSATPGRFDVIANSLSDLAHRSSRFCHLPETQTAPATDFPFELDRSLLLARRAMFDSTGDMIPNLPTEDDIILPDVAAFDVKFFCPDALIEVSAGLAVEPDDVGFTGGDVNMPFGAFADVGHKTGGGWFAGGPTPESQLEYQFIDATLYPGLVDTVYDIWTPDYERDGRDQDGDGLIDEATNGIDDDGMGGVDDQGERETQPPYLKPVRGIKVTFRMIEKRTKQVRQSSIIHSFVPQ